MNADLFGEQPATEPADGEKGRLERGAFFTPDALALAICKTLAAELPKPASSTAPITPSPG